MRSDSVVFGVAGIFFGVLVGWIIGSQQGAGVVPPPASTTTAAASGAQGGQPAPPAFDESRAASLKAGADRNPSDPEVRVQLGNLYFDAERYDEAARWYEAALKVDPKNVNASTDLGIAYYYNRDPDKALAQFDKSLAIDPSHAKTLLNVGVVRAFGKQDLKGAVEIWKKLVAVAPTSEEARLAKQAIERVGASHPELKQGS